MHDCRMLISMSIASIATKFASSVGLACMRMFKAVAEVLVSRVPDDEPSERNVDKCPVSFSLCLVPVGHRNSPEFPAHAARAVHFASCWEDLLS